MSRRDMDYFALKHSRLLGNDQTIVNRKQRGGRIKRAFRVLHEGASIRWEAAVRIEQAVRKLVGVLRHPGHFAETNPALRFNPDWTGV